MKAYDTSFLLHAKFLKKKFKKSNFWPKTVFAAPKIYVKIFTKCLISLGILNRLQQMRY